ncbi:hypothetical protein BTI_930 [Burkholderia thailandensis MSMB121]|uniref:hypothetical protein n=1 Tax=Burkholderia humptydooensis TaxID=430531 RepID=UPI0003281069|nr:hypothetical protein [Burkholderia humptydooensis]AGK48038.1 hypothetical protein BTI_930 [Burkholderia thailandensis MSMB121]
MGYHVLTEPSIRAGIIGQLCTPAATLQLQLRLVAMTARLPNRLAWPDLLAYLYVSEVEIVQTRTRPSLPWRHGDLAHSERLRLVSRLAAHSTIGSPRARRRRRRIAML